MVERWYAKSVSARDDGPLVFFRDYVKLKADTERLANAVLVATADYAKLRAAAERVVWFDWSDNDADAVAAIDSLRAMLAASPAVQGGE